ncbi:MAG TPA: (Fe-S)-binding protein [Symbiobacteriaceae bacterium]
MIAEPAHPMTARPLSLDEDSLYTCMRCGFCLPACPTYRIRQVESAAPRGRIGLMKAVYEGKLDILQIADHLDLCLGCRACEVACPAGVPYGHLLEQGRALVAAARPLPPLVRFAYNRILGTPGGIRLANWALWLYQVSGLRGLVRRLHLLERLATPGLASMEQAVPPVPSPLRRARRPKIYRPLSGRRRLRVAFFTGCISDIVFPETNDNAMKVLAAAGCEVVVVPGQGCCGAVHSHAGEHETALRQAKRNIAAFEKVTYDYIVTATGGCGAALKEYGRMLAGDPEWSERARRFSAACRDFSELLDSLGTDTLPRRPLHGTVTYQDSCHLRNGQKVTAQSRKLLQAIPGIRYVELPESDRCCGAAGTYAIFQTEMSDRILDEKIEKLKATGADTLVVANAPCQLEMIEGIQRAGLANRIRVRHIADVLAEALAPNAGQPETDRSREVNMRTK